MAASDKNFTGVSIKTYVDASYTMPTGTLNWAAFAGTGKLIDTGNEASEVADIGDQTSTANIVNYAPYGATSGRSLAGLASPDSFTFAMYELNTNSEFKAFRDAAIGTDVGVAVVAYESSTKQTAVIMQGELAAKSRRTPKDDVASWEFTIALAQNPVVVDQA